MRPATCADDNQGCALSSEHTGSAEKITVAYNAVPAAHRHRTV
ncbi:MULTISPECIES: hypothetical protein [Pseudomonadaceae]|nr:MULTISPECIES: hypothetical protein [Pseudomonas]